MSQTEVDSIEAPERAHPSYRRDALLAAGMLVTVAVLLAVAAGRHALANPDAFTPDAAGASANLEGPRAAGAAMTGVMTYGPVGAIDANVAPRTVDVVSITPRITQNSADADVRLVLCPSGSGSATAESPCAGAVPFTAGPVALGYAPGQQLWVVATAHAAGTLVVDGYDVSYRDGLQSGSQHVGGTLTLVSTS